ncbi:MAG TPA: antirestriction protein ArdA, partial [Gammaproteobacteria bacterium]|nr:antirestriction protein ArdA [Gammaproteobacteria bacterium]
MIAINSSLPAFCNSDNTPPFNSLGDQPQIYVACLASSNAGRSHGAWIDATQEAEEILEQIDAMLSKSPKPGAEEYAIYAQEGFCGLKIAEHASIEDVHEQALFVLEHGELDAKLLAYYYGDVEYAKGTFEDYYHGEYESELDYATAFFDECYLDTVPDTIRYYIDYDSFKTDI